MPDLVIVHVYVHRRALHAPENSLSGQSITALKVSDATAAIIAGTLWWLTGVAVMALTFTNRLTDSTGPGTINGASALIWFIGALLLVIAAMLGGLIIEVIHILTGGGIAWLLILPVIIVVGVGVTALPEKA